MDAPEFKVYTVGPLLLKRSSAGFEVERQQVLADQLAQGRSQQDAERRADDPDYYRESSFVPSQGRWEHSRDNLHHQVVIVDEFGFPKHSGRDGSDVYRRCLLLRAPLERIGAGIGR